MDYVENLELTAKQLDSFAASKQHVNALCVKLREAAALLRQVPEAKREKVAMAMRALDSRLTLLPKPELPLSDAYPDARIDFQARLVLGEKPASVTGLTAKEAHEFLVSGRTSPGVWLLLKADLVTAPGVYAWFTRTGRRDIDPDRDGPHGSPIDISVPMARWVVERYIDPAQREALTKHRTERGPHGEEIGGSYLDRIDEIQDSDLRPSVRDTFTVATTRLAKALERDMLRANQQAPLAPEPAWWQPVRCATLLNKSGQLALEGKEMSHCVASYVPYVRKGKSVIVSLRVKDKAGVVHKSTAEIDRSTLSVLQHKGIGNQPPSKLSQDALKVCLRRWEAKKNKRAGGAEAPEERLGNPARAESSENIVRLTEGRDGRIEIDGASREANPADRAYLQALRGAKKAACNLATVRTQTKQVFDQKAGSARAKRGACKLEARAEIETARAERDNKRFDARAACDTKRSAVKAAKGIPQLTQGRRRSAAELAEMRDAEARASFSPAEWHAWQATGGGRHWKDEARKSGIEAFRDFAATEDLTEYAPDVPTRFEWPQEAGVLALRFALLPLVEQHERLGERAAQDRRHRERLLEGLALESFRGRDELRVGEATLDRPVSDLARRLEDALRWRAQPCLVQQIVPKQAHADADGTPVRARVLSALDEIAGAPLNDHHAGERPLATL